MPLSGCLVLVFSSKRFSSVILLLPTAQCDILLEIGEREVAV